MNQRHDKEAVIKKGIELFWAKGYHNLGVDTICQETGMTKGAFYNAFKNKETFLLTTIENYGDFISNHLQNKLATSKLKAFDRLLALYKDMLDTQAETSYIGCFVNNTMSEMGALNTSIAAATSKQFTKFLNVVEPTVREAQNDGDLNNSIASKLLTEIIHTTFFGLLTRSKSLKTSGSILMTTFLNTLKN